MQLFEAILDTPVNSELQSVDLSDFLEEDLSIIIQMVGKRQLVPFVAHPALSGVHPEGTFFDFFVAKHTREDDLVHVTGHRILD